MAPSPPPPAEQDGEPVPQEAPIVAEEEYEAKQAVFDRIFAEVNVDDAKEASKAEREAKQLVDSNLAYGELSMRDLHELLNAVKTNYGPLIVGQGAFLDLGSGAGKLCVAAALLHPFEKVIGIECLESLHKFATDGLAKYQEEQIDGAKPDLQFFAGKIEDEAEKWAAEAMVCLAVATCYTVDQLLVMKKTAEAMRDNSIFITFTHMLPPTVVSHQTPDVLLNPEAGGWVLVEKKVVEMQWGETSCFIHKKMPAPPKPEEEGQAGQDKPPDAEP